MVRTIIVAYNEKFVIGDSNGKVPWHIPEDFNFFKETTMGHPCIMGRTTWDSLPDKVKPLPGRKNIVVSRNPDFQVENENVLICHTIELAMNEALKRDEEVFITGGSKIYNYCLHWRMVDRILASEVKEHKFAEGITFFPDVKQQGWKGTLFKEFKDFNVIEYKP